MKIELTADFILSKLSTSVYTEDDKVNLGCDEHYHFIELALDQANIKYETKDVEYDNGEIETFFIFDIESIKEIAPTLYETSMNIQQSNSDEDVVDISDLIETNGKLYTFDECYDLFNDKLSKNNFTMLSNHICRKELAEYVQGFMQKNGYLYILSSDGGLLKITDR
jgi:hypothetical protein